MLKKWMIAVAFVALGCGDDGDDPSSPDESGSKGQKDASAHSDGGSAKGTDASRQDSGKPPSAEDASVDMNMDDMSMPDAASTPTLPDGGSFVHGSGSCCEVHSTPGCGNADLEVCVCEKDPSCCTTAWGPQCTIIVAQKFCQPNVRDCVCGTGQGQWAQTSCCESKWGSSCDSVATIKCSAVAGCF